MAVRRMWCAAAGALPRGCVGVLPSPLSPLALHRQTRRMTDEMASLWLNNLKPQELRGRRDEDSNRGDYVVGLVNQELDLLRKEGWDVGIKAYTSAMSIVGRYGKAEAAQELFDTMVAGGVKPTRLAYNSLLFAYVNSNTDKSGEKFLAVFQNMEEECDTPADVATVAAVLHGLAKRGLSEEAQKAAAIFKKSGTPLSQHSYNILLSCAEDTDQCGRIRVDMEAAGFSMDEISYGSILKVCAKTCSTAEADAVFEEMRAGFTPTVREWTGYLTVFKEARDLERCMAIWRDMALAGVPPNTVAYGAILRAHTNAIADDHTRRAEYAAQAEGICKEAIDRGCVTSDQLVLMMMTVYSYSKNAAAAKRLLGLAKANKLRLLGYTKKAYSMATGERIP